MTTTTQMASLPPLGTHQRDEIGQQLQATLIELLDLALVGKQLHWSIVGPLFRPLHQHLDELVEAWHTLADAVAERAVALGSFPDGQATAIATGGTLPPPRGPIPHQAGRAAPAPPPPRAPPAA